MAWEEVPTYPGAYHQTEDPNRLYTREYAIEKGMPISTPGETIPGVLSGKAPTTYKPTGSYSTSPTTTYTPPPPEPTPQPTTTTTPTYIPPPVTTPTVTPEPTPEPNPFIVSPTSTPIITKRIIPSTYSTKIPKYETAAELKKYIASIERIEPTKSFANYNGVQVAGEWHWISSKNKWKFLPFVMSKYKARYYTEAESIKAGRNIGRGVGYDTTPGISVSKLKSEVRRLEREEKAAKKAGKEDIRVVLPKGMTTATGSTFFRVAEGKQEKEAVGLISSAVQTQAKAERVATTAYEKQLDIYQGMEQQRQDNLLQLDVSAAKKPETFISKIETKMPIIGTAITAAKKVSAYEKSAAKKVPKGEYQGMYYGLKYQVTPKIEERRVELEKKDTFLASAGARGLEFIEFGTGHPIVAGGLGIAALAAPAIAYRAGMGLGTITTGTTAIQRATGKVSLPSALGRSTVDLLAFGGGSIVKGVQRIRGKSISTGSIKDPFTKVTSSEVKTKDVMIGLSELREVKVKGTSKITPLIQEKGISRIQGDFLAPAISRVKKVPVVEKLKLFTQTQAKGKGKPVTQTYTELVPKRGGVEISSVELIKPTSKKPQVRATEIIIKKQPTPKKYATRKEILRDAQGKKIGEKTTTLTEQQYKKLTEQPQFETYSKFMKGEVQKTQPVVQKKGATSMDKFSADQEFFGDLAQELKTTAIVKGVKTQPTKSQISKLTVGLESTKQVLAKTTTPSYEYQAEVGGIYPWGRLSKLTSKEPQLLFKEMKTSLNIVGKQADISSVSGLPIKTTPLRDVKLSVLPKTFKYQLPEIQLVTEQIKHRPSVLKFETFDYAIKKVPKGKEPTTKLSKYYLTEKAQPQIAVGERELIKSKIYFEIGKAPKETVKKVDIKYPRTYEAPKTKEIKLTEQQQLIKTLESKGAKRPQQFLESIQKSEVQVRVEPIGKKLTKQVTELTLGGASYLAKTPATGKYIPLVSAKLSSKTYPPMTYDYSSPMPLSQLQQPISKLTLQGMPSVIETMTISPTSKLTSKSFIESKLYPESQLKTFTKPLVKTEIKTQLKTQIKPLVKTEVKTQLKTQVKSLVKTQLKTQVKQRVLTKTFIDTKMGVPIRTTLGPPPIFTIPRFTGKPRKTTPQKTAATNFGYELYVKRYGKYQKLGGLYSRAKAIKKGERRVRETLAASFKLKQTKQRIAKTYDTTYRPSAQVFRGYKIVKGKQVKLEDEWIQRRKYRLSKRPEVSEIQIAKGKKKRKAKWL